MIRTKLDYNQRTTICSLLTSRVHARDTIKHMIDSDVRYTTDFLWKLYMKYEYTLTSTKPKKVKEVGDVLDIHPLEDFERDGIETRRSQSSFKSITAESQGCIKSYTAQSTTKHQKYHSRARVV